MNSSPSKESRIERLMLALDSVLKEQADTVKRACVNWITGVQTATPANDPTYRNPTKRYRRGFKKPAIVSTIHSILSRKFQKVLSSENGPGAAWLLGLWPKVEALSGFKTVTPPQLYY